MNFEHVASEFCEVLAKLHDDDTCKKVTSIIAQVCHELYATTYDFVTDNHSIREMQTMLTIFDDTFSNFAKLDTFDDYRAV